MRIETDEVSDSNGPLDVLDVGSPVLCKEFVNLSSLGYFVETCDRDDNVREDGKFVGLY